MADDKKPKTDEKLIETAKKRFELCVEAEKELRDQCLDDLKFRAGQQWPEAIKRNRELDGRPCLTINRLPQFLRQVTNEQRQNRQAIHVNPVDDNGDPETAEILQGLVRHIEQDSNADIAYDTAAQGAATHGFGYFRLITEYDGENSFDQVIKIKRIRNPFAVYVDPTCQEPDYSDAGYAFFVTDLTKDEYMEQYPESELASLEDWESVGNRAPDWIKGDSVRIAEYCYKEKQDDELLLIQSPAGDSRAIFKSELKGKELPKGFTIANQRPTERTVIKWCTLNGVEVLEETVLPGSGKWIPIVPVLGDELDVDGKRILEGVVRHAKDPQRMYNYWASAETESIALAPKAPFIAAAGSTEDFPEWRDCNTRNYAVLHYKTIDVEGKPAPPPQRQIAEPAVMAITQARMASADDLKATTGIYDAALGNRSNEQTGKAILARQNQSQVANFHYIDNLSRAIRHCGRIILDWIPTVYDKPRVVRIIGEDGEQKTVKINQASGEKNTDGTDKIFDLTTGKYDVTVTAGPSYTTKRQEAVQSMLALIQAAPQMVQAIGDLLVKEMDWPGAKSVSDRLKKLLPPNLQEGDQNDPAQQLNQMQSQMQQIGQQHEMLVQQLNQATEVIQQKQIEQQGKLEIEQLKQQAETERERIKGELQLAIAEANAKAQEPMVRAKLEQDLLTQLLSQAHERGMQAADQAHQRIMAPDPSAEHEAQESPQLEAQEHASGMEMQGQ